MSNALTPDSWLILGMPWPKHTNDEYAECAAAVAPQVYPRHLVSQGAGDVLDLADALSRAQDGPGKTVFFSDITRWLDGQGKTWNDLAINYEKAIEELLSAPVPVLNLSLSQVAHLVVCDASRDGGQIYYSDGAVEQVTPQTRADVHAALTAILDRDWLPYIQSLIDRGPVRGPGG